MGNPVIGVRYDVGHKLACTATEEGKKLEIWNLGRRGIVRSVAKN